MSSNQANTISKSYVVTEYDLNDSTQPHHSELLNLIPANKKPLGYLDSHSSSNLLFDDKELSSNSKKDLISVSEPIFTKTYKQKKIIVLQKWEGIVQELLSNSFIARLTDKDNDTEEEAEILLDEIDPNDTELLEPGAIFYWSIGYDDEASRKRFSMIKFRRLPTWNKEELEFIKRNSTNVRNAIGWE